MKSIPETIRRVGQVLIVVLFAAMLSLPEISSFIGFAPRPNLQEKRLRAEAPEFKFEGSILAKFPAKFEAYFNDNFPYRDQLVLWHNFVKVRGLKTSPCPKVVIGKDDWLFYQEGLLDNDHAIAPFTDEQLSRWIQILEDRQAWLAAQGMHFVIVIAPDKQSIYPEYLPDWVKRVGLSPRLDQFLAYARKHSNLTIVDLREPLLQAKEKEQIYFKTDSHWNFCGAFTGARCIAEVLSRWYPQVQPLSRSAYLSASRSFTGDLANMLALPRFASIKDEDFLLESRAPSRLCCLENNPVPTAGKADWVGEIPDSSLPKALVFHDSFGAALLTYLSQHFRRLAYDTLGREDFDTLLIEREKPDVVICEWVERRLTYEWMPCNPGWVTDARTDTAAREKFADTQDIRLSLSNPGIDTGIVLTGQVAATAGPTGLILTIPDQYAVLLPRCACDPQGSLLVRLDITSPGDTVTNIYYSTDKAPGYASGRQVDRWLHKGRNIVYLEVPGPGLTGQLRLDPGRATGQYILHGVEVRELPPTKGKSLREKFAEASNSLLSLSNPGTDAGIDVCPQATVSSAPTGLVVQASDRNTTLLLPPCECDPQGSLLVRLDVTSPGDTVMDLFYQTSKSSGYSAERQISRGLPKGRNEVYLEVPGPGLTGRLRLDPGRATGQYILHGVEVRELPPSKGKGLREKFTDASTSLLSLSNPGTDAGIDVCPQATVSSAPTGLVVQAPDRNTTLLLPPFAPRPSQGSLLVRLDITSPGNTCMDLFYTTGKSSGYSAERQIERWLHKGRNVIYLEVPEPGLTGRLRLDPGRVTGQYILHGFEARDLLPEKAE